MQQHRSEEKNVCDRSVEALAPKNVGGSNSKVVKMKRTKCTPHALPGYAIPIPMPRKKEKRFGIDENAKKELAKVIKSTASWRSKATHSATCTHSRTTLNDRHTVVGHAIRSFFISFSFLLSATIESKNAGGNVDDFDSNDGDDNDDDDKTTFCC